ncbi:MAG: hypothetical protein ACE5FF_06735 [Saprospiraceae bacterium]
MKNRFSTIAFTIAAIALASVVLFFPRYERQKTEAVITWDVSGYYLYLPAGFIYHDLEELKFLPDIIGKYQPSYAADQAFTAGEKGDRRQVMKYPVGMALLYLPFFLVAHGVACLTDYPADGFSYPYQVAIQWEGVLMALLGLWFLRKNLLVHFSDKVTAVVLGLIALGTNFFNYATFDAAMPHVFLFTLLALLVHFTMRWYQKQTWANSLAVGACAGMAALVRPTEIIFAVVPVLWGIGNLNAAKSRLMLFLKNWRKLLLTAFTVAAIGLLQLGYWKYITGHWLVYSYKDQGFSFLHPHFVNVLFSYRKGWFIYTPVMLFAVAGFFFLAKNYRKLFLSVFAIFFVTTWIVAAWDIWWYGGAFGQRAFIQSYAVMAFPLAAFVTWSMKKKWTCRVTGILLAFCTALNLFQTYQAHLGPFETEIMNRAYYWRVFGKTENNPYDRLLLDVNEGFSGTRKNEVIVYSDDFEQTADTTGRSSKYARSGTFSLFVDSAQMQSPPVNIPLTPAAASGKRLHISAWFFTPRRELEAWWMPQMAAVFLDNGHPVKKRIVRPGHVLQQNEWRKVWMDIRPPKKSFGHLQIQLLNPRNRLPLYMDDLLVELFEE